LPKLTGKKKLEFLKRLNKGRIAKGLKAIKAKGSRILPKTALRKRKTTSKAPIKARKPNKSPKRSNNVAKSKGSRRSRVGISLKKLLMGGGVGIALELLLSRLGATSLATDVGYIGASQVGNKAGVLGNAIARQAVQRFGGQLGFLGSGNGNGNGNGQTVFTGFA